MHRRRKTKITKLYATIFADVEIRRAHVAMNDSEGMSRRIAGSVHRGKCFKELGNKVDGDAARELSIFLAEAPQQSIAVNAVDEFKREKRLPAG